jgi:E3 ubiquitin-protein ligase DOA10
MARGKGKNISNRNHGLLGIIRTKFSHYSKSWIHDHTRKARFRLKSYLMMIIENLKKDINNPLKEIQENTGKQIEGLKQETQKSLKELQENTTKQVKELNKPSRI